MAAMLAVFKKMARTSPKPSSTKPPVLVDETEPACNKLGTRLLRALGLKKKKAQVETEPSRRSADRAKGRRYASPPDGPSSRAFGFCNTVIFSFQPVLSTGGYIVMPPLQPPLETSSTAVDLLASPAVPSVRLELAPITSPSSQSVFRARMPYGARKPIPIFPRSYGLCNASPGAIIKTPSIRSASAQLGVQVKSAAALTAQKPTVILGSTAATQDRGSQIEAKTRRRRYRPKTRSTPRSDVALPLPLHAHSRLVTTPRKTVLVCKARHEGNSSDRPTQRQGRSHSTAYIPSPLSSLLYSAASASATPEPTPILESAVPRTRTRCPVKSLEMENAKENAGQGRDMKSNAGKLRRPFGVVDVNANASDPDHTPRKIVVPPLAKDSIPSTDHRIQRELRCLRAQGKVREVGGAAADVGADANGKEIRKPSRRDRAN